MLPSACYKLNRCYCGLVFKVEPKAGPILKDRGFSKINIRENVQVNPQVKSWKGEACDIEHLAQFRKVF